MSDPVTGIISPIRLEYAYTPGLAASRFLNRIAEKQIVGQKCPQCGKVYVPPRGSCPKCGVPTKEEVTVADTGTVTTFCIVNIPFAGSVPLMGLIQEVAAEEVRMGMRVKAVWADELRPTLLSIKYFAPVDEPDVPIEKIMEYRDA